MFETVEGASEICVYYSMPSLGCDGRDRAHELSASIVHEEVNSSMFLHCVFLSQKIQNDTTGIEGKNIDNHHKIWIVSFHTWQLCRAQENRWLWHLDIIHQVVTTQRYGPQHTQINVHTKIVANDLLAVFDEF